MKQFQFSPPIFTTSVGLAQDGVTLRTAYVGSFTSTHAHSVKKGLGSRAICCFIAGGWGGGTRLSMVEYSLGSGRICNGIRRQIEVAGHGHGHQDLGQGDSQQRVSLWLACSELVNSWCCLLLLLRVCVVICFVLLAWKYDALYSRGVMVANWDLDEAWLLIEIWMRPSSKSQLAIITPTV